MSLIRISESNDWTVDYDRERGMYRVSYFEDGHFRDEHWFDAYEDKECLIKCKDCSFKHYSESGNLWCDMFNNITFKNGYCYLGGRETNLTKIGSEIIDEFNSIPEMYPITAEEIRELLK